MLIKPHHLNETLFQRYSVCLLYGHELSMQVLGAFFLRDLYTCKQTAAFYHISETDFCQNPTAFLNHDLFSQEGQRFLWISEVTGKSKDLLARLDLDTLLPFVVLTAPALRRTSPLIKWGKKHTRVAILGCYDSLLLAFKRSLFPQMIRLRGVTVPEALWPRFWDVSLHAWPDLLEKITLLVEKGGEAEGMLTEKILSQLRLVPDETQEDWVMDMLINKEGCGSNVLSKGLPVAWVHQSTDALKNIRRAVAAFSKLLFLKATRKSHGSIEQTLSAYRPPLFFKEVPFLKKAMDLWTEEDVMRFLLKLGEEEKNLKKKEHAFMAAHSAG